MHLQAGPEPGIGRSARDPRERHIVASETAYRVSPYPQITDVHALGDQLVQVLVADFEAETRRG